MTKTGLTLAVACFALLGCAHAASTTPSGAAGDAMGHWAYTPDDVKWAPGPPSLPAGAQFAVLYGDPSKEGLFAMRIKFPAGFHVPPHTHPGTEAVTVLSGTFLIGMGEKADKSKAKTIPAGGFFAMPAGMQHFAYAEGETVIQLNSVGPFSITYVNPKDDPRKPK